MCVDTPFVSIIRIEAYTFVDASSSNGKFVNVKVVLPLVVSVVTLPSAKLQATLPETEPFATIFCPKSFSTSCDWSLPLKLLHC